MNITYSGNSNLYPCYPYNRQDKLKNVKFTEQIRSQQNDNRKVTTMNESAQNKFTGNFKQ